MSTAKYTSNYSEVVNKQHTQVQTVLRLVVEDILRAAAPITPKKLGNLSKDVLRSVVGFVGTIEWRKVYAQAQEAGTIKGKPIKNYTTAGTGKGYAEKSVRQVMANIQDYFDKAKL